MLVKKVLSIVLVLALVLTFNLSKVNADDVAATIERDTEIADLKTQVQELLGRIEKLEQEQVKTKEDVKKVETAAATGSRVDLANALSKLKMKGRMATGYYHSGQAGSFGTGSWEVPEGKIQFSFEPDKVNTVVMRMNLNNASSSNSPFLDYFYLQSKDFLSFLKETPFSLNARLGRFKLGVGEETWSNNPVEGILPSNSAGNVGASDEGVELAGKIKLDKFNLNPLGWAVSASNGNSGVTSDTNGSKAFMARLYHSPISPLYLSMTYYNSGNLETSNSELSIAGLSSRPGSAANWERKVLEFDARYDFGKGKKPLDPPVYSDSKAIVRLSYGVFHDIASTAAERSGNFGFVDGIYNLNKKFYTAGRISFVDLDSDITATLNSVTTNKYNRYSLGAGYRWSDNTILKVGYDWNKNSGPGVDDADDNLVSAIVATQF